MGKHLLEAERCERMKAWSCRSQQADAKCHTSVTCFWVFVTRGALSSPPALACSLESSPGPWPHHPDEKGTSLPCPRESSLASSLHNGDNTLQDAPPGSESVDVPENPALPNVTLFALFTSPGEYSLFKIIQDTVTLPKFWHFCQMALATYANT